MRAVLKPIGAALAGLGLALLGCIGCTGTRADSPWPNRPGPKVLVSFPPLYSFAANVAGDDASVRCLRTNTGPHAHGDPGDREIRLARHADVLFINGLGLDEMLASKLKGPAANPHWNVVELGELIDKKDLHHGFVDEHDHGHGHAHEPAGKHDHDHDADAIDPHVWLGHAQAKVMVGGIRDTLKKLDPSHADNYDRRTAEYLAKLDQLHRDGLEMLKGKKERKLVSFHGALHYFADSYGLTIVEVIQVEPGAEPGPAKMKQIVDACVKDGVRVIAVEPQFPSNTSAQAVRGALRGKGIDAVFVEIDPLETANEDDLTPDFYERKMRRNLENLERALK